MKPLDQIKEELSTQTVAWVQTDPEGRILSVNEHFTTLGGWEFAEVEGRKPKDFLQGPLTEQGQQEMLSGYLRNRLPISTEITNYHKNREPYQVHLTIFPLLQEPGNPKSCNGFFALEFKVEKDETLTLEKRKVLFQTAKAILRPVSPATHSSS